MSLIKHFKIFGAFEEYKFTCLISFLMAWTFSRLTTDPFLLVSSPSPSGVVKGEEMGTIALSAASKFLVVDIPYNEAPIDNVNTKRHVAMMYETINVMRMVSI